MLETSLNFSWRPGVNRTSERPFSIVSAVLRAVFLLAVTGFLLSSASSEAATSSTTTVDAFHYIGGWFGESVTPSGLTLRGGKTLEAGAEDLTIRSVTILGSGEIELLLDSTWPLSVSVESSLDLNTWIRVEGAQVQNGRITFSNPLEALSTKSHSFFRLRINP